MYKSKDVYKTDLYFVTYLNTTVCFQGAEQNMKQIY